MSKYLVVESGCPYLEQNQIGEEHPISKPSYGELSDAVAGFFVEAKSRNIERDPLVFAMNPQKYVVVLLSDDLIITGHIRMDIYSDLIGGSLTFNPENLNNSDQKPEGSA